LREAALQCGGAVTGFADDFVTLRLQERTDEHTEPVVVVDNEDRRGHASKRGTDDAPRHRGVP
jgi:hypothetical protein